MLVPFPVPYSIASELATCSKMFVSFTVRCATTHFLLSPAKESRIYLPLSEQKMLPGCSVEGRLGFSTSVGNSESAATMVVGGAGPLSALMTGKGELLAEKS